MRIATWNVNSIKVRLDRLLRWLDTYKPDALCLQEIKTMEDSFPRQALLDRGYVAAVHGQKTYNGVAILAKGELSDLRTGLGGEDPQARLLAATVDGVRVVSAYFPNGGEVASEKWHYKLSWMQRLTEWLEQELAAHPRVALTGDFNVAPSDLDAKNPSAWADTVLCHPEARALLAKLNGLGFVDTFRALHPERVAYSWWDYRMLAFPKDDGLRIDHIYATPSLAATCRAVEIDRDERKGEKPSDHVPVYADFEL